jgi:hypothetical protein
MHTPEKNPEHKIHLKQKIMLELLLLLAKHGMSYD